MSDAAAINNALNNFFTNGRVEVGLEVGADAGLSPGEYVQIPRSFKRSWAAHKVGTTVTQLDASDPMRGTTDTAIWASSENGYSRILIHGGKYYAQKSNGSDKVEVDEFRAAFLTHEHVKRFVAANIQCIRADEVPAEHVWWILAIRFWSVITGLVTTSKSKEWVEVNDPTGDLENHAATASRIMGSAENSLTACAARAASWRKSNHATGGELAAGFPRRWLQKNAYWPSTGDVMSNTAGRRQSTTSFYVSTHAVSVHAALAMMAPEDESHWALVDPSYGMTMSWDVLESTSIRIAPKTQVAGTAMVVDSIVVAKMVASEGLAPLLENINQMSALKRQYDTVAANGVRVASYAGWFLEGHPERLRKVPFSQKEATCAELIGELGHIARNYYKRSTIGESLALENASQQMATATSKDRWTAITKAKASTSNEVIMAAYNRIKAGGAGEFLQNITSNDQAAVDRAVESYNQSSRSVSAILGINDPTLVSVSASTTQAPTPASSTTVSQADAPVAPQAES